MHGIVTFREPSRFVTKLNNDLVGGQMLNANIKLEQLVHKIEVVPEFVVRHSAREVIDHMLPTVKLVRQCEPMLGLKEAKDLVEACRTQGLSFEFHIHEAQEGYW